MTGSTPQPPSGLEERREGPPTPWRRDDDGIVDARGERVLWDGAVDPDAVDFIIERVNSLSLPPQGLDRVKEALEEHHKLDTDTHVFFYEQDFYVLSNFSAFSIMWPLSPREGLGRFDTSEAVYHWEKFKPSVPTLAQCAIQAEIHSASSAHEAFKIAERNKQHRRTDWDDVKVGIMRDILRAKADQHEYVRRKLLATGERILVEDSWRDDFWGWGPNRDGQNMLGKLWMEVRSLLRGGEDG